MAHVFISYAREDLDFAEQLAERLQRAGFSVWWDRSLLAGADIEGVIDTQIQKAGAVIVVWSQAAEESYWVKSEASAALSLNKLVPIRKDSTRLPRPYDQIHTLDLSNWSGKHTRQIAVLINSVRSVQSGKAPKNGPGRPISGPSKRRIMSFGAIASASILALAIVSDITDLAGNLFGGGSDATVSEQINLLSGKLEVISETISPETQVTNERLIKAALRHLSDSAVSNERTVLALVSHPDPDSAAAYLEQEYRASFSRLSTTDKINWLHQIAALTYERDPDKATALYGEVLFMDESDPLANTSHGRLLLQKNRIAEGQSYLERAYSSTAPASRSHVLAALHFGFSQLYTHDFERAEALLTEARSSALEYGFIDLYSQSSTYLSQSHYMNGRSADCRVLLEEIEPLQVREGFDRDLAISLSLRGTIAFENMDYQTAQSHYEKQLEIERALDRQIGLSDALTNLGRTLGMIGAPKEGREKVIESLAIARQMDMPNFIFANHLVLTEIDQNDIQSPNHCRHLSQAERLHPRLTVFSDSLRDRIRNTGCGYGPENIPDRSAL